MVWGPSGPTGIRELVITKGIASLRPNLEITQKARESSSAKTEIRRQTQLYMTSRNEYYLLLWALEVLFFFRDG